MNISHYKNIREQYLKEGTIVMSLEESFLSENDFSRLEALSEQLPYECITVGDAGEKNFLNVGRFMTDIDRPKLVNQPLSDEAVAIVSSKTAIDACKIILNESELYVRRMQVNQIEKGCFVGNHYDTDSNPDYLVAIVLQLGHAYEGGEYIVSGGSRPARSFKPKYHSVTMSNCVFPHEVATVTSGKRTSIVYFLSNHNGENKRK